NADLHYVVPERPARRWRADRAGAIPPQRSASRRWLPLAGCRERSEGARSSWVVGVSRPGIHSHHTRIRICWELHLPIGLLKRTGPRTISHDRRTLGQLVDLEGTGPRRYGTGVSGPRRNERAQGG